MEEGQTHTPAEVAALLAQDREESAQRAAREIAAVRAEAEESVKAAQEAAWRERQEAVARVSEDANRAIAKVNAEFEAVMQARAQGYREGIGGERLCSAIDPDVLLRGEPVLCQREAGHPLGPLDRHKAVDSVTEPHQAFVWNKT